MASKKNKKEITKSKKTKATDENVKMNSIYIKILVFLGVIIFGISIIYLMNYFFVEKNYIKINISTDKKLEYIKIEGQEKLITTQKYVSDLNYSMRYDINNFKVLKYKDQDIYKFNAAEKILLIVEKSTIPSICTNSNLITQYTSCLITPDDYTEEYYITSDGVTYKITIKSPNANEYESEVKTRINYMLESFKIN